MDYQRITVYLIGNATRDGRVSSALAGSTRYGEFRLAVRNREGASIYYPVRCFGGLAEGVRGIQKGTRVFVDGELEIAGASDASEQQRMTFWVVANTYRILDVGRQVPATAPATAESENQ